MYNFKDIEEKWQKKWEEEGIYNFKDDPNKEKLYCLEMFSYPSGAKLHLGHWYNFGVADTWARYKRMQGYNVFEPMGFDAFGLPAENYAIKTGIHPRISTEKNIDTMEHQLRKMGAMFDWSHEIVTCREDYYKWTQWMFLQLYKNGLAYKKEAPVNWCDKCKTVLANEQVISGECERCGTTVIRKNMSQWFFKITKYAEELLQDLDKLDWPEKTKILQTNWIGKSEGAYVGFKVDGTDEKFTVFTTRCDTLFGATYCVLSPEHELVDKITTPDKKEEVEKYKLEASKQSEIERTSTTKEKTGVFIGAYAINPINNKKIPIYISDYVLSSYGTGAIMAVPAHDERDYEFAKKFNIDIIQVLEEVTGTPHEDESHKDSIVAVVYDEKNDKYLTINWHDKGGRLFIGGTRKDGESPLECATREIREETGYDDIEFVRETFKINHHYYAYNKDKHFEIESTGLLFKLKSDHRIDQNLDEDEVFDVEWVSKDIIDNEIKDELHLKTFAYTLNDTAMEGDGVHINSGFLDGLNKENAIKKMGEYLKENNLGELTTTYKLRDWLVSRQRYWGAPIPVVYCDDCGIVPVPEKDLPVVLPDDVEFTPDGESPLKKCESFVKCTCPKCGKEAKREVDTLDTFVCSSWYYLRYPDNLNSNEPFNKELINKMLPVDKYIGGIEHACMHLLYARFFTKALRDMGYLNFDEPFTSLVHQGLILGPDGEKMSKSKGNTVSPDEYVDEYGADVLRGYLMFGFNYVEGGPWSDDGIKSIDKFYQRIGRVVDLITEEDTRYSDIDKVLNNTIKSIREDIERFQFNTCIARIMEYTNALSKLDKIPRYYIEQLLLVLAPFAPHISEELWNKIGNEFSIHNQKYPEINTDIKEDENIEVVVQINGKVRGKVTVPSDISPEDIKVKVREIENVKKYLEGSEIVKEIYIPKKLVSIVIK
jgi:leucyl-tRNA synthetase